MVVKYVLLLISLVTFQVSIWASSKDSLSIVRQFESALQSGINRDSMIDLTQQIIENDKANYQLRDVYYIQYSRFLVRTGLLDSAMTIANLGISNATNYPTEIEEAKFYNIIASVLAYKTAYPEAIQYFQKSIRIFDKYDKDHLSALIKNNIANIFLGLKDYASAYKYSTESLAQLKIDKDTTYLPSIYAITSLSAVKLGYLDKAKTYLRLGIELSEKYNNPLGKIISYYSMGEYHLALEKYQLAIVQYEKSLKLSNKLHMINYSMLSKIGLCTSHNFLGNNDQVIKYGHEALELSDKLHDETVHYYIHKQLSDGYAGKGLFEKSSFHIHKAHDLYTANLNIENSKTINELLIKYDTEKKEKELMENELLLAQNEREVTLQKLWLLGLSLLLLIGVLSYWYRNNLQKHKRESLAKEHEKKRLEAKIIGEENEKSRIANELHDSIASSITGIKIQLELLNNDKSPRLNKLINNLTELHENTRRISHNLMPISLSDHNFVEALKLYCVENANERLSIKFIDNTHRKIRLDKDTKSILYRMVQELINNVMKHAQSDICYVQLSISEDDEFVIAIEDEGVGFDPLAITNSKGLKSIHQRITSINGDLKIISNPGEGALITLAVKLDNNG